MEVVRLRGVEAGDHVRPGFRHRGGLEAAGGPAGRVDDGEIAAGHGGPAVGGAPRFALGVPVHAPALAGGGLVGLVVLLGITGAGGGQAQEAHGGGDGADAAFGQGVLEGAVEVAGEALLALGGGEGDEGAALLDEGLELGVGEEVVEGGGAQACEAGGAGDGAVERQVLRGDQLLAGRGRVRRGMRRRGHRWRVAVRS